MRMRTCHAQPSGERSELFVVGSAIENSPAALRVAVTGADTMTASSVSTTVVVGVNVSVPEAGVPFGLVYRPVTTLVTTSSE